MAAKWGKWVAIIGGVLAVIGQWVPSYYLPVIGGVLAIVGGFVSK